MPRMTVRGVCSASSKCRDECVVTFNRLRFKTGLTFLSVVAVSVLRGVENNGNCPPNRKRFTALGS